MLTGGRSRGAESTAAAAGEADEALEGGPVEEESEEPIDDEAEVCCCGVRRAESGIIRSRGPLDCFKYQAQVNLKPNITCAVRRLKFLGLVILELETSPNFPVWCKAIHEHESREVS